MSHSVGVTLIANQSIHLLGKEINVYMLISIVLDDDTVTGFCIKDSRAKLGYVWVENGDDYIPQSIDEYEENNKNK